MTKMTKETLDRLESEEAAANLAARAARRKADCARMDMAEKSATAKGIVANETTCLAARWGFDTNTTRVFVVGFSNSGKAICAPITGKDAIHKGHNLFTCSIDKVNPEETI
jgi:hypothetical protein